MECETCGSVGMKKGADGFHYCLTCGTQSQHFIDEDLGDFQPLGQDDAGRRTFTVARQANVQRKEQEALLRKRLMGTLPANEEDEDDPEAAREREEELLRILSERPEEVEELLRARNTLASRFSQARNVQVWGTDGYDPSELHVRLASHVRDTYLEGMQKIIQMQCEALVEVHGVNPMVCGLVGPLWVQFVGSTRVFEKEWPDEVLQVLKRVDGCLPPKEKEKPPAEQNADQPAETQTGIKRKRRGRKKIQKVKVDLVPVTTRKKRVTYIWLRDLKRRMPLCSTLSIIYLACYIAREPVHPTDITAWATDGTLPYINVFKKFQSKLFFGPETGAIPLPELEPKLLFMPKYMIKSRVVECLAGVIANRLGLELPPVNFHALSKRILEDIGLAGEDIMYYLERLYEWYTPEGIWLSGRRFLFPNRAYVAAMLIVTIKLVYGVNGGSESTLYWPSVRDGIRSKVLHSRDKFQSLLGVIEKRLLEDEMSRSLNLKNYLNYCREFIYPVFDLPAEEESIYDHLWELYEKEASEPVSSHKDKNTGEVSDRQSKPDEDSSSDESSNESSDESEDTAEFSRAPTLVPKQPSVDEIDEDEKAENKAAEELAKQVEQHVLREEEQALSRYEQDRPLREAKSRLVKSIATELRLGNFRLLKRRTAPFYSDGPYSFPLYFIQRHSRKFKKVVHGDYFLLLFACARSVRVRCNILHKCVQVIEMALWNLERRVAFYDKYGDQKYSVGMYGEKIPETGEEIPETDDEIPEDETDILSDSE